MQPVAFRVPTPRRVTLTLVCVVLTIVCLSSLGQFSKHVLGHDRLKGLVPLFYLDLESSVPTWYSSAALLLSSALLALIAAVKFRGGDAGGRDKFRWHWTALAALFALLSLDEIAMIHELPIQPLREAYGTGGIWYYPWVGLGMLFVGAVGIAFTRFLLHLPRKTRWLMLAAGCVFVGGAIGVEMASGAAADARGEESAAYAVIITLEESLEMLGIVIFIHALVDYLASLSADVRILFGPCGESAA